MQITRRMALLFLYDIIATYAAYFFASFLTGLIKEVFVNTEIFFVLGILSLINLLVFSIFKQYNSLWEYASIDEVVRILLAVVLGTLVGAAFLWIIDVRLPIRVFTVACILTIFLSGGIRFSFRFLRRQKRAFSFKYTARRPRTLIVGAGETGSLTISRMASKDPLMPGIPLVVVDDDPAKHRLHIHGVKVEGRTEDIVSLVDTYGIEQIVVAIPSATPEESRRIYGICTQTDCRLRTLPNIRDLRIDEIGDVALRDVNIADLLGREEVLLNTRAISGYVTGKVVLVTGGGGSIGGELCRQLRKIVPKRIVIFDICENEAFLLQHELLQSDLNIEVITEIGSVCDEARLDDVFAKHRPNVVFHAAAHKHVPLMEGCPREAIRNNVFGSLNTVRAADRYKVDRFIFVSTDKAVNPTSVMGVTKRIGEMIVQHYAHVSDTVFTAVRFGNVLGSSGSVIPVFKHQIAAGGPVTVTHPEIERYFMTIPEASRLVIQAGTMAEGGEIFILDMGNPVKILDLAKNLIQLSGFTPGVDIEIEFTGLRTGEKMYEELLLDREGSLPTAHPSIMVVAGRDVDGNRVSEGLEKLEAVLAASDAEAIRVLKAVVPEYRPAMG